MAHHMPIPALLAYVAGPPPTRLHLLAEAWLSESARLRSFMEDHRDKLRKKWRLAPDDAGQWDVLAELYAAYTLARDKHITLAYETYTAAKERGPDFTATYTTRFRFNVEVTRLRTTCTSTRWAEAIIGKLPQFPPSIPNVLFVATNAGVCADFDVATTMASLRTLAGGKDEAFFVARGLVSGRDFLRGLARISAIAWHPGWDVPAAAHPMLWYNPAAKHPLPPIAGGIFVAPLAGG